MNKYRIVNRHMTVIWEGEHHSYYDAWRKMFEDCGCPAEAKVISQAIDMGMWIEKIS